MEAGFGGSLRKSCGSLEGRPGCCARAGIAMPNKANSTVRAFSGIMLPSQLARAQRRGWVAFPLVCVNGIATRQVGERKRCAVPCHLQVQHARDVALHGIERNRVRDPVAIPESGLLRFGAGLESLNDLLGAKDRLVVETEVELADGSRYAAEAGPEIVRLGQHQPSGQHRPV